MTRVTGRFEDSHVRLRFGDVEFDALTRQLWRGGQEVHLSTKAFDLLTLLMERRPTVVPKPDIKKHLWPETFVSDTNLPTLIAEIRDAIGDDGRRARFVRTVYGFGYSFVGDAVDSGIGRLDAVGWLIGATHRIAVAPGDNVLGREGADVLALDSPTISRRHAKLTLSGDTATLEDLGSKNGTYVNEVRVTSPVAVADGDVVRTGSLVFTFRFTRPGSSTQTI
jgi:DNA-binding winged helix-turn-helix (wHTH) protein